VVTDRGGETRRRILESARTAFAERGYAGTSMADLIRAAGVTKGGFYFHFASKQELAVEVVESAFRRMQERTLAAAAGHERAADRVVAMVRALEAAKLAGSMPAGVDRLCQELRADPVAAPEMHRPSDVWVDAVAGLLAEAQSEGDLPAGVYPRDAARFAVAAYVGLEQMTETGQTALAIPLGAYLQMVSTAIGLRTSLLDPA